MPLTIYQVDSFTDAPFRGNPAAICYIEKWLSDADMQSIASEMNLSETSFIVPHERGYYIRWFTPTAEVKLCGHATLAAAHVLFSHLDYSQASVTYESLSGPLVVTRLEDGQLQMDFPTNTPKVTDLTPQMIDALGGNPTAALHDDDLLLIYNSADEVRALRPNFQKVAELPFRGVITAAISDEDGIDVNYRFFAPGVGINEDPVTGSAMTELAPYFQNVLGKSELRVHQCSARGGFADLCVKGDRITITGHAVTVLSGEVITPNEH